MRKVITAEKLLTPDETFSQPIVVIEDGVIASIASRADAAMPSGDVQDYPGATLVPSYFDVHLIPRGRRYALRRRAGLSRRNARSLLFRRAFSRQRRRGCDG